MSKGILIAVKQAMLIPAFAFYNMFIGLFVSGYSVTSQHMSELALETEFFAYSHRLADILIGLSMCWFAFACFSIAKAKFTFLTMFSFGMTWVFAGIFIMNNPLHDIYGLTTLLIVVPVVFALEMREFYGSKKFQDFSILVTLIHVAFFWAFDKGLMPIEYKGITQRIWVAITLIWYGIAAYQMFIFSNKQRQPAP
ncbi:MAG: DUF998 domain-containing protein [Gammaproteobacteria bacterium]|nr:DUF998 domain-containing protein [Gammaproteobacteria bacterium]MBU1436048.1 DUF998 domain-containing protein [Gammaproteobacteria bacterium]